MNEDEQERKKGDGTFRTKFGNTNCGLCEQRIRERTRVRYLILEGKKKLTHCVCPGAEAGQYLPLPANVRERNKAALQAARAALPKQD